MAFRVIFIDQNRARTRHVVNLDAVPQVGDHLELPLGETVVVHHVTETESRRSGYQGIIIAGTV